MSRDPFATAELRAAVLEAWRRSPARLREDANTEEDHARGYYRDRVVVELAQNAADAATRTGVPGRLLLRLLRVGDRPVLLAANTGAPVDAAGVAALASMRASAKRDEVGAVGRFGVGFAAVRSVADEIVVATGAGAVRFSVARTRGTLAEEPGLADELARRGDSLPALRLPFDVSDDGVPHGTRASDTRSAPSPAATAISSANEVDDDGRRLGALARKLADGPWATVVGLELRDEAAAAALRDQLQDVGDPLLLALPGLGEILVETPDGSFAVADVAERWHIARASGTAAPELLADRPTEERASGAWQITWALPRGEVQHLVAPHGGARRRGTQHEGGRQVGSTQHEGVVLAPTPTQEPLTLPALLVATLPLDPTRRHVVRGPLTDELVRRAGDAYALLGEVLVDAGRNPLDLVPLGLPAGELDARLRESALEALAAAPVLTVGEQRVAPRDASAIAGELGQDPAAVVALARAAENLVLLAPGDEPRAAALGVRIRPAGDVVDELAALPNPADWRDLYVALAPAAADPAVRESLGALGIPLADGRTVRGARGTVIVRGGPDLAAAAAALAPWGLRAIDPDAEHPLLERLGAEVVDATGLLAHAAARAAVEAATEDDGLAAEVAPAILTLAGLADELPTWIGDLPLPEDGGGYAPARELALAGSPAEELFDPDLVGRLDGEAAERWPVAAQIVLTGLRVAVMHDIATGPSLLDDDDAPAGWSDYLAELSERLGPDAALGDLEAVADLDAVDEEAWPDALRALDNDPHTHRAVTRTVQGCSSFAAWWLRHESPEELELGDPFALDGADPVLGRILRPAPAILEGRSDAFRLALGGVRSLADLDAEEWAHLDLGEEGDPVDPATARAVWEAFVQLGTDGPQEGTELVPAVVGPDRIELTRPGDVVVVTARPWFARADVASSLTAEDGRWELRRLAARGSEAP